MWKKAYIKPSKNAVKIVVSCVKKS